MKQRLEVHAKEHEFAKMTGGMEQYLNEREVSEMTGIAVQTLRNDRAGERKLFPYCKIGKSVRYRQADVLAKMEGCKVEAGSGHGATTR